MTAETIGLLISGVSGVALPLMEKAFGAAARAKALNLSFTSILRSLYFEISTNLRTLAVIESDKLRPGNLAALASALEIEACAAILFADDPANTEAQNFLALRGKVEETAEDQGEGEAAALKHQKTVLHALLFIVQRIAALQKIAAVYSNRDEEKVLINVRVPVRIRNIREHLLFIKKKLAEFDKEKNFLFK
jgi:hypothetical protein